VNALIGQNGFLTSAIFIFGMSQLSTRPFLAGATLGLLIIKPQLALTLPVAFLAGREWRGIAGGVVSGAFMLLAALVVFGASTYQAFFDILPKYTEFMSQNRLPWNELASVFAFCRFVGIPQTPAAVVQALVALAAIFVTWRAWRRDLDTKIPILAAATLLLPPYLYTYDTLLLILPLGWFILHGHRRTLVAILWLLCFLPFIAYDYTWPGPTTIPIAAILSIWFLYKDARANSNALPEPTPGPATATSV
jgi:hypothetical protein